MMIVLAGSCEADQGAVLFREFREQAHRFPLGEGFRNFEVPVENQLGGYVVVQLADIRYTDPGEHLAAIGFAVRNE
jgi:hypothetical protein